MNLTNFLKQTDSITAQYSADQLISFIHDTARVLPEHDRADFLKRLEAIGKETQKASDKDKKNTSSFKEKYKLIKNNLKLIDSQEVTISSTLNEEYDDWYNSSAEEFLYEDNEGISDMLEEACDFVHTCLDGEQYQEGFEIGKQMLSMEIMCDSEYGDEELSLGDMVYHELLDYDLKHLYLDIAYCAYHAVPLKERPDVLYGVIENTKNKEITLEAIMQHGDEELPDFHDFLPLWIASLGNKAGCNADRLILEAAGLLNDVSIAANYAEKYVSTHPGLYLNLLENGSYTDVNERVSMGMKALKLMPKKYTMRGKVALTTAEYLIQVKGNPSLLEACYFAAYESDTSAMNYLRALLHGYGSEKKKEELQKVFMALSGHKSGSVYSVYEDSYSTSERKENKPDSNMILILRFLDGQFAHVLAKGLDSPKALGWSGTFMKQGIALYLLYLYEGQWTGKGILAMSNIVKGAMHFSAEEYGKGICGLKDTKEEDLFCELFLKWKSMVQMEPDVKKLAIQKITGLLEKRTEGIMDANRRNYYGECAAYIAALGEVQETMGDIGTKQRLMTSYKEKYSRRNAFRAELRNYGWIDVRKK